MTHGVGFEGKVMSMLRCNMTAQAQSGFFEYSIRLESFSNSLRDSGGRGYSVCRWVSTRFTRHVIICWLMGRRALNLTTIGDLQPESTAHRIIPGSFPFNLPTYFTMSAAILQRPKHAVYLSFSSSSILFTIANPLLAIQVLLASASPYYCDLRFSLVFTAKKKRDI